MRYVAAALMVLALAGCAASGEPAATSTPDPRANVPVINTLVVTTENLGYITIDQPVPDNPEDTAIASYYPAGCIGSDDQDAVIGDPYVGAWFANYTSEYSFTIVTADGTQEAPVSQVNVYSPFIESDAGVSVGNSVARLERSYDSFAEVEHFPLTDVYAVDGDAGRLFYEVSVNDPDAEPYWSDSEVGKVVWIRLVPAGTPLESIAGTDAGGPCAA